MTIAPGKTNHWAGGGKKPVLEDLPRTPSWGFLEGILEAKRGEGVAEVELRLDWRGEE